MKDYELHHFGNADRVPFRGTFYVEAKYLDQALEIWKEREIEMQAQINTLKAYLSESVKKPRFEPVLPYDYTDNSEQATGTRFSDEFKPAPGLLARLWKRFIW